MNHLKEGAYFVKVSFMRIQKAAFRVKGDRMWLFMNKETG